MDEGEVAIVCAAAQSLPLRKLTDVSNQLIDQDDTGGMELQQITERILARRSAVGISLGDERKGFLTAELPGQLAPQCVDRLLAALPGLPRRMRGAVKHGNARLREVHQARSVHERGNTCELGQRALARGQVIDRKLGVGLAAAEGGLKLDDRLAALAATCVSKRLMPSVMKVRSKNAMASWYSRGARPVRTAVMSAANSACWKEPSRTS